MTLELSLLHISYVWEHTFFSCFWWYPQGIKVNVLPTIQWKSLVASPPAHSDWSSMCWFLCLFVQFHIWKNFDCENLFLSSFPFLLSKYCKPIFDASLFELKKDIFNVYSTYPHTKQISPFDIKWRAWGKKGKWNLLYIEFLRRVSSRWKWKILIKQKALKIRFDKEEKVTKKKWSEIKLPISVSFSPLLT